jgi:Predicted nucleic acid-binding protein, consists of a PIN domain and a Zn-ribbon module
MYFGLLNTEAWGPGLRLRFERGIFGSCIKQDCPMHRQNVDVDDFRCPHCRQHLRVEEANGQIIVLSEGEPFIAIQLVRCIKCRHYFPMEEKQCPLCGGERSQRPTRLWMRNPFWEGHVPYQNVFPED